MGINPTRVGKRGLAEAGRVEVLLPRGVYDEKYAPMPNASAASRTTVEGR